VRKGETDQPGFHKLALAPLTVHMSQMLGMGTVGCAYRGSEICLICPYASKVALECDWRCWQCTSGGGARAGRMDRKRAWMRRWVV
jgi:hypothetical protein